MKKQQAVHDEIARAAYELYEKRDRADGHEIEDWLEAEKLTMEEHERHAGEIERGVDVFNKPNEDGFRQTVKKGGFYKKS